MPQHTPTALDAQVGPNPIVVKVLSEVNEVQAAHSATVETSQMYLCVVVFPNSPCYFMTSQIKGFEVDSCQLQLLSTPETISLTNEI